MFRKGYSQRFEISDLYEPLEEDRANRLGDRLERQWNRQLELQSRTASHSPSLVRAIFRTLWKEWLTLSVLALLAEVVLRLLQPIFLGRMLLYFREGSNMTHEDALYYAGCMVAVRAIIVLCDNQYGIISVLTGIAELGEGLVATRRLQRFLEYDEVQDQKGQEGTAAKSDGKQEHENGTVGETLRLLAEPNDGLLSDEVGRVQAQGTPADLQTRGIELEHLEAGESDEDTSTTVRKISHTSTSSTVTVDSVTLEELTSGDPNDADIGKEKFEASSQGSVPGSVFLQYVSSAGSWLIFVGLVLLFAVTQLVVSIADWWLSYWTALEERGALETAPASNQTQPPEELEGAREHLLTRDTCVLVHVTLVCTIFFVAILRAFGFYRAIVLATGHDEAENLMKMVHNLPPNNGDKE
uniref:ABC transmembrane type-1 domain-containing protein n=1 Tax=Anopheles stephensi TaxID=30069 RepID=A0A182XV60_ANOST